MQENNGAAGSIPREEYRLDLYSVLSDIKDQWITVLLLTVSAILLSYVMLSATGKPAYTTTSTVAVRYSDEDPDVNSAIVPDVNTALKYAGEGAKNLKIVLGSGGVRAAAAKESELGGLRGSISAEVIGDTNLLVIKDTADSPDASLKETEAVLHYLVESGDQLLGGIRVDVVQPPRLTAQIADRAGTFKYSVAIGIVFFVVLCALLAWHSSMRFKVRNSAEVAPKLGLGLLAEIPHEKKGRGKEGLLITDPAVSNGFAEEMRSLAVRLMNEMSAGGQKILLVSSTDDGEGKSTAAANIALAMSQMNRRVILADLDFRNPSLAKILNMQESGTADLMRFLENSAEDNKSADLNGLIRQVPGTELSAVLNSKALPLAVDKYAVQIRKCLQLLGSRADFVIVDTAASGAASDAEALVSMADASALIVRENFAEVKDIEKAVTILSKGGHLLGCVFNNARKNTISADATKFSNGGQYAG